MIRLYSLVSHRTYANGSTREIERVKVISTESYAREIAIIWVKRGARLVTIETGAEESRETIASYRAMHCAV